MKSKLLCITPIAHIGDLKNRMSNVYDMIYLADPSEDEVKKYVDTEVIFTNPNKSKVYLGSSIIDLLPNLKVIATASTGTVHIDKIYCDKKNIKVISIMKELSVLEKISSTAEHAFLLTLSGLRNLIQASNSVTKGEWDYEKFVGRQINQLKVGVIGFGRLGKMYAHYVHSFGAKTYISDPYKEKLIINGPYEVATSEYIFKECDVIALHIHATEENIKFISGELLEKAKDNLLLVNTSRGEIIDEDRLLDFLRENPGSKYYTDVIDREYDGIKSNKLYNSELYSKQIVITPHIGGMSIDAQILAYNHCFKMLCEHMGVQYQDYKV